MFKAKSSFDSKPANFLSLLRRNLNAGDSGLHMPWYFSFHHCLARCELTTTMMFEDASHGPMIFVNFSGASRGSHWFPWFQCWDPTLDDASIPLQGAVGLAWSPSGICLMHPDAACDEKLGVIRREQVFHSFSVCKADSQDSSRNGFSKSSGKRVCLGLFGSPRRSNCSHFCSSKPWFRGP